jgi:hypothetical protein
MDSKIEPDKSPVKGWFNDCSTPTSKELIFIFQLIIILIVVISCILNLTFTERGSDLWIVLLSSSIGYLLPAPRLNNSHQVNLHSESSSVEL